MNELIKKIRRFTGLSQTEFAEELNVTFATVNRWENGHAVPNGLAQDKLYDFCKKKSVPVYDMITEKIEETAKTIPINEGRLLLYHGSKSGIEGKITPTSRAQCDFGRGFYMGTELGQALTLICDYEKAKLYLLSFDIKNLNLMEVPLNMEWAMTVAFNRGRMEKIKGSKLYNKYEKISDAKDVIVGYIANDRMFYTIDNFFIGNITDAALINSLSALKLGKQYVAKTQKACNRIRIEKEISFSYLEKLFIKEVSEMNREKGISLANEICKKHRREGLYFDELLERD